VRTFLGAKRLECVELAPALGAPTLSKSASKLDALQTLRVTRMPLFSYVSVFKAAHTQLPDSAAPLERAVILEARMRRAR
jgi:hypothetical protein